MANKVSTQLLITAPMRDRVRALAVVRDEVQAETLRELNAHAVPAFESDSAEALEKLSGTLAAAKIDFSTGVKAILDAKLSFRDVLEMTPAALRKRLGIKG